MFQITELSKRRSHKRLFTCVVLPTLFTASSSFALACEFHQPEETTTTMDTTTQNGPVNEPGNDHVAAGPANRLIHETSPYLLQHAYNPVDWYAWGEEAFEAARREQKPIFLSIGYSTCYWCHVMERESFESVATAEVMNANYICIKVDREERPDVDDIYMKAVQMLNNGNGGWPMSVFLTPPAPEGLRPDRAWEGLQPFWAGTYLPPTQQFGRPSFTQVLEGIANAWLEQPQSVTTQAAAVANAIRQSLAAEATPVAVGQPQVDQAAARLMQMYDADLGGFGRAPKFPQPVFSKLLLAAMDVSADESQAAQIEKAVRHTLDRMATGGMYDQIGGGFHRYSTDDKWLVPHFEKMLYDNGQLAWVYADAAARFDDPYYREIAQEICEYVLREMTDDDRGSFYSAQDAEVNHREGQNYLWIESTMRDALTQAGANDELTTFALRVYGLDQGTNFRDPHHPEDDATNVIFLIDRPDVVAENLGLTVNEVNDRLTQINSLLLPIRDRRDQPHLDDKTITAWNGLMIAGMAKAGDVLERDDFIQAAERAWEYIDSSMRNADGLLLRTSRNGKINDQPAFCEDYALLAFGLIALYDATGDTAHRDSAEAIVAQARELFWDVERGGGYFDTLVGREDLFVRGRNTYDGAVPSGNGTMLLNLVSLYATTQNDKYLDDAMQSIKSMSAEIKTQPLGTADSTRALLYLLQLAPEQMANLVPFVEGVDQVVQDPAAPPTPPAIFSVSANTITITPDAPASFKIRVELAEGYHVNAHEPGDDNLIGMNVRMVGSAQLQATVIYPESEIFQLGEGDPINVYSGTFEIEITVSQTVGGDEVEAGTPELVMSYQICTNTECLLPEDVVVPVKIIQQ